MRPVLQCHGAIEGVGTHVLQRVEEMYVPEVQCNGSGFLRTISATLE